MRINSINILYFDAAESSVLKVVLEYDMIKLSIDGSDYL
jgi:hypothetical protein